MFAKKGDAVMFIPYPKAIKIFQERFGASKEEIAAWIRWPDEGGIQAWVYGKTPAIRQKFYFYPTDDETGKGYLAALPFAWFDEDDIAKLISPTRYITAEALIERWRESLGDDVENYIFAKIAEDSLSDLHPETGITQWSGGEGLPPKETALFHLDAIEQIEAEEFVTVSGATNSKMPSTKTAQSWKKRAYEIGQAWMLDEERRIGARPGVVAISMHVASELQKERIYNSRGDVIPAETIKRDALTGITGRKPNGKKS